MTRTRKLDYTGSKRFDSTCRNHGSCGYCEDGRTHNNSVEKERADSTYLDAFDEEEDTIKLFYEDMILDQPKAYLLRLNFPVRAEVWFQRVNVTVDEHTQSVTVPRYIAEAKGLI